MVLAQKTNIAIRWVLAGPMTLVAAVLTMASTPLWFPKGAAGIDNLIFAIILFPAFWALFVFYSLMEPKPLRGLVIMLLVTIVNAFVIYRQF